MRGMMRLALLGVPGTQGGASLLPFSDDFARADGDLANGWDHTPGAWVISSGNVIATPPLGAELLTNGTMEDGDPPTAWIAGTGATLTSVADERTGGEGAASMEATRTTSALVATQTATSTAGQWLRWAGWLKNVTSDYIGFYESGLATRTYADAWEFVVGAIRSRTSNAVFNCSLNNSSGMVARYDDLSIREIAPGDAMAVRDVATPYVRVAHTITVPQHAMAGVVLALDSRETPQTFIIAYVVSTSTADTIRIEICDAGSYTVFLDETTPSISAARPDLDELLFEAEWQANGAFRVFIDGRQAGEDYFIDPASLTPGTFAGMLNTDPVNSSHAASIKAAAAPIPLNGNIDSFFSRVANEADLWTTSGTDDWLGRPVLADDGTKWIAIYRSGTGHQANGAGKFHIRFSEDEGVTWTAEDTFIDSELVTGVPFIAHAPNTDCSDALLLVAPNGDILVLVEEATGTYQYRSTNGGASFSAEGLVSGGGVSCGQDYTIVGDDIYLVALDLAVAPDDWPGAARVLTSDDNGVTWTLAGTIESDVSLTNETGIVWTGGTHLLVLMRDSANVTTYQYDSYDLGSTWSARTAIPDMGAFQRPRLHMLAGGVIAIGRDGLPGSDFTVVWYSDNAGGRWGRKFYTGTAYKSDCGYADLLEKTDGNFYVLTYGGSIVAAAIRSAVFGISE